MGTINIMRGTRTCSASAAVVTRPECSGGCYDNTGLDGGVPCIILSEDQAGLKCSVDPLC